MSENMFKIHDKVDGDFEIERTTTHVVDDDFGLYELTWREQEPGLELLTLNEILHQVKQLCALPPQITPFIRVFYEIGLWGVIFEVGNYTDMGNQWIVHGITKGYA